MEGIADIAIKEKFQLPNMQHQDAKHHIRIYDVDNRIKENLLDGYTSFMDGDIIERQKIIWKKELETIIAEIDQEKPEHVFLSIHGVYYRFNNYFSIIDNITLAKFRPTVIITLIDDIYDVADRVTKKEIQYKTNSSCNLSEALGWRTVETLMADKIAENLYLNPKDVGISPSSFNAYPNEVKQFFGQNIPHFILSAKHNLHTFYRLLFERKRLHIYSSFPITSTRTNKASIDEINDFKQKLEKDYIVFDPAAIDEFLLKSKSKTPPDEMKLLNSGNLIQSENENYLLLKRLHGNYSRSTELPASLQIDEMDKIKDAIIRQIEKRDYRMVHQSQVVVAYRPFWGNRSDPAGGVDQELRWAIDLNKGALAYHNNDDDGKPKEMFTGFEDAKKFETKEKLFDHLKMLQQQNAARMKTLADTWE